MIAHDISIISRFMVTVVSDDVVGEVVCFHMPTPPVPCVLAGR